MHLDEHMSEMFDYGLALFGAWLVALNRGRKAEAAELHAELAELKEEMRRYATKCGSTDHPDPAPEGAGGVEPGDEDVPRHRPAEQATFHVEHSTAQTPNKASSLARQALLAGRRYGRPTRTRTSRRRRR